MIKFSVDQERKIFINLVGERGCYKIGFKESSILKTIFFVVRCINAKCYILLGTYGSIDICGNSIESKAAGTVRNISAKVFRWLFGGL